MVNSERPQSKGLGTAVASCRMCVLQVIYNSWPNICVYNWQWRGTLFVDRCTPAETGRKIPSRLEPFSLNASCLLTVQITYYCNGLFIFSMSHKEEHFLKQSKYIYYFVGCFYRQKVKFKKKKTVEITIMPQNPLFLFINVLEFQS